MNKLIIIYILLFSMSLFSCSAMKCPKKKNSWEWNFRYSNKPTQTNYDC